MIASDLLVEIVVLRLCALLTLEGRKGLLIGPSVGNT